MTATAPDRTVDPEALHERLVAAAPLQPRHLDLAGIATNVLEGGSGPPLVLLHGQGECWAVWLNVLDDLVADHRLVVVDLPGHGASSAGDGNLDAGRLDRWLDELVDATCDAQPVLVGHLLGGAIAMRYAVGRRERIRHLVLVDSLGLSWFRPSPRFAIPMARFLVRPTPTSRDRLFDKCFADFDRVGSLYGDTWDDLRTYVLARATSEGQDTALKAMMPRIGVPPVPGDDRDRIDAPVTLIHGRDDLQVPLRAAERASRRHGWPLRVIEDCRDDPAAEQPAAFVAALRRALEPERPGVAGGAGAAAVRAAWDAIADGFDRHTTPHTLALGEQVVDRLGVAPGMQVLDVAAGSGALSLPAARAGAEVVAVDIAPGMVERLGRRASAEGLSGLDARVDDGTALDLADDAVDLTMSMNGISVFDDLAGGLREAVRVTRSGGEVAVVAFGPLPQVEFIAYFLGALRSVAPDVLPPAQAPLPPFRLADPEVFHSTLAEAGLHDVEVEPLKWSMAFGSAADLLEVVSSSNPIAVGLLARIDDEQRERLLQVLDGMLRERSGGSGATLTAALHLGRGRV